MKRVALILALILGAGAVQAEPKLSLAAISEYLNGLKTARMGFIQYNDDGSKSTGQLLLNRPGRMRFEYDPPNGATVVAGGGTVVIHDPKSNQPPESYPLRRTPLSLILARKVDLGRANMVVGHTQQGEFTVVSAQDPENPEYGSIDMMFDESPIALRRWVIHDGSGGMTTVVLNDMATGMKLDSSLFDPNTGAERSNR